MPDGEETAEVSYKFPLREKKINGVQVGERIRSMPASLVFTRMFDRIPSSKIVQNNAYGEVGGDLVQHANLQSRSMALRDQRIDAMIEGINSEDRTVRVRVTFPTFGNDQLWGNTSERTVVLPFDDLVHPIDKITRRIKSFLKRRRG
jgi:hypothetical protein